MGSDLEINDEYWMKHALRLAEHAVTLGEVPVGAVLTLNNEKIAEGWNQSIARCDPTAHAEIVALREAAIHLSNYRLLNTTLYVTLEPCAMCAGAMIQARIKRLVFGALDARSGAIESVFNIFHKALNHKINYQSRVLSKESSVILKSFFKSKR